MSGTILDQPNVPEAMKARVTETGIVMPHQGRQVSGQQGTYCVRARRSDRHSGNSMGQIGGAFAMKYALKNAQDVGLAFEAVRGLDLATQLTMAALGRLSKPAKGSRVSLPPCEVW
jgi:hypothetical protein